MALLLAMYQKLRLIRERNQLTLEMTQTSSKLTRIEKNIERTQKYYTSLFQQIDSQAKMLQNNATRAIQNMAGLGVGSFNPYDSSAYSGLNGFVLQNMAGMLFGDNTNGVRLGKDSDGNYIDVKFDDKDEFENMLAAYRANGGRLTYQDENGQTVYGVKGGERFDENKCKAFMLAMSQAQQNQQQAQFNAQQMSSNFANGISIWTDAMKADLECQQDAALEPLTYEQTMLELDKTLKENRLKRIEAELESYSQLVDKGAEEMAPKFGLG